MPNPNGAPKWAVANSASESKARRMVRDAEHILAIGGVVQDGTYRALLSVVAQIPTRPAPAPRAPAKRAS